MPSIPLILTPLFPHRAAVPRGNACAGDTRVPAGADGASQAAAPPRGIGDIVAEGTRKHLGRLAETIHALLMPREQKNVFEARLAQCRARFDEFQFAVTHLIAFEDVTARTWGADDGRNTAMSARVLEGNIKVAAHCHSLQKHLADLHADIQPHVKERNVAKTVGLAIGALVGLAAATTLAVLLWPVVVGGAAVAAGFLLTGACAAAGGAAAGGIAAAALCARELVSVPQAYRNFPETQPELAKLIEDIDSSLVQWVLQNADYVEPMDGDALLELFGDDIEAAQAFCSNVHASSLSVMVKSLVPVPPVIDDGGDGPIRPCRP